eukprot:scaffold193513_cov19-Tisochrysis_lutea.AAC.1
MASAGQTHNFPACTCLLEQTSLEMLPTTPLQSQVQGLFLARYAAKLCAGLEQCRRPTAGHNGRTLVCMRAQGAKEQLSTMEGSCVAGVTKATGMEIHLACPLQAWLK